MADLADETAGITRQQTCLILVVIRVFIAQFIFAIRIPTALRRRLLLIEN